MHALFCFFGVLAIGEMLLYFAAPHVYAYAAWLPFGPTRRLVIHPRATEALRAPAKEGAGYRDSALGRIDLARLEAPRSLEIDGLILHFHLDRGFALARFPYSFGRRLFGLTRVNVIAADNALELRPRFIVMGWPSLLLAAPMGVVFVVATMRPSDWTQYFVMGALFVGINVVIGLMMVRGRLEVGVAEIERQLQAALVAAETEA